MYPSLGKVTMEFYATICRLCETSNRLDDDKWLDLFSAGSEKLLMKIEACANVKIEKTDSLPKRICGRCSTLLQQAYDFRMQCEITDAKLRHEIEFLEKNNWDIGLTIPPIDCGELSTVKGETNQKSVVEQVGEILPVETLVIKAEQFEQVLEVESESVSLLEESETDIILQEVKESFETDKDQTADEVLSNGNDEEQCRSDQSSDSSDSEETDERLKIQEKKCRRRVKSKETDEEVRSNICETCGEKFAKRSELYDHRRTVHGNKRFQCSTCSKWFSRKARLQDHELRHSGLRQFECTECGGKYATQISLKKHMEDMHSDDLPYVCDKCGKGFAKPARLRIHYSMHIESRNFLCGVCSKGYKTKAHLNMHMKTHLPQDQKKVRKRGSRQKTCVCPYCGKVSMSTGTHTMHIRTHTGEQRYECHICFKRFTSSGSHKKHLRVHSGEKPFTCEYCQKSFRQKHHMTTHIRGVHTNEKPYECKFCPKAFATRGNMMLHLRSHGVPDATSMIAADSSNNETTASFELELNDRLSDNSPMLSC